MSNIQPSQLENEPIVESTSLYEMLLWHYGNQEKELEQVISKEIRLFRYCEKPSTILKFLKDCFYGDLIGFSSKEKYNARHVKRPRMYKARFIYWVRDLHMYLNIPYNAFGIKKGDATWMKQMGLNTELLPEYETLNSNTTIISLKSSETDKSIEDDLVDSIIKADSEIIIYDYLEKHVDNSNKYADAYKKAHEIIYSTIERKVNSNESKTGDKGFSYTRFLSLGRRFDFMEYGINILDWRKSYYEMIGAVIEHCHEDLFRHICRVLAINTTAEVEIIAIPLPRRTNSWGVIDKERYILSEYYTYNNNAEQVCKPDIVFVEPVNTRNKQLLQKYHDDIRILKDNEIASQANPRLSLDRIHKAITVLIAQLEEKKDLEPADQDDVRNKIRKLNAKLGVVGEYFHTNANSAS